MSSRSIIQQKILLGIEKISSILEEIFIVLLTEKDKTMIRKLKEDKFKIVEAE